MGLTACCLRSENRNQKGKVQIHGKSVLSSSTKQESHLNLVCQVKQFKNRVSHKPHKLFQPKIDQGKPSLSYQKNQARVPLYCGQNQPSVDSETVQHKLVRDIMYPDETVRIGEIIFSPNQTPIKSGTTRLFLAELQECIPDEGLMEQFSDEDPEVTLQAAKQPLKIDGAEQVNHRILLENLPPQGTCGVPLSLEDIPKPTGQIESLAPLQSNKQGHDQEMRKESPRSWPSTTSPQSRKTQSSFIVQAPQGKCFK